MRFGRVKVAYARVMLIGPGGVGKSSLLKGLMNQKFLWKTCSTQVADTYSLRSTECYWARSTGGGPWVIISDEDEIKELAQLFQRVRQNKQFRNPSQSRPIQDSVLSENEFSHPRVRDIIEEIEKISLMTDRRNTSTSDTEVYLRVWDCGGQPVFLNLFPAFLTARTLFLLMFDASRDLNSPCLHLTHHEGMATPQTDSTTTLDLIVQWMATIHATLLKKGIHPAGDDCKIFPRILPVGTHGDSPTVKENKESILRTLSDVSSNKAFTDHLEDGVVVDNTTAGTDECEDPAFQTIREIANKFATKDLAIDTPITWVLFRKVFQRYSRKMPVVALDEVKELAKACLIPEDSLSSVLAFYHDLSVFFHYTSIPSLASKVIADPQWLIKQMANILAMEGFEEVRSDYQWKLLRTEGLLVEPLYRQVLSNQKELEPQEIVDLLEHFLVVTPVSTKGKHKFYGREYFVPSMLARISHRTVPPVSDLVQSAAPLHIVFSTNYLPPGFFARLVTVLSKDQKFVLDFKVGLYRNEITFCYGHQGQQVDRVIATEEKSSVCILVHRVISRPHEYFLFPHICQEMLIILRQAFEKIKEEWFPGIEIGVAFECNACQEKDHFIPLETPTSINYFTSFRLFCQKNVPSSLTSEQKCWLHVDEVS
jgi:GTPase SAR1 family protein